MTGFGIEHGACATPGAIITFCSMLARRISN